MRLVAAVAHFAEPAGFLPRLRASLDPLADATVELDGRWALMPGDGDARWPSQVAKRDELMRLASESGDWILVIDGDEYVESCDGDAVRAALASTDRDVAEVTLRNLNRAFPYSALAPMRTTTRRLYRAGTTLAGPAHYDYHRDGRRLNGDRNAGALTPALDLSALLTIAHDNRARPAAREAAAQEYRRARRRERVEIAA